MKRLLKMVTLMVVAVLTLSLAGCGGQEADPESKGDVTIGYVQWDSEIASTNVMKKVLEDLGYNVTITAVDAAAMRLGVQNGDFDGIVAAWLPNTHGDYFANVENDVENLGPNLNGAKVGLVVPQYVTIDSIEELNDVKARFNGVITGIEPGAGVMRATEEVISEYGLDFSLESSSSAGMAAALQKAVSNEEWIAVTGWTPHWKFAEWDLKYLEDPKGIYGGEEHIATIVRKGLAEDNPEVYSVLDKFQWEASDMEKVMLDIKDGMEPAEAAAKWVEENQDKVNQWIEQ